MARKTKKGTKMKYLIILLLCLIPLTSEGEELEIEFTMDTPEAVMTYTHDGKTQWNVKGETLLEARPNGDFYVNGRLTTNDMEVYEMWKEWLEYTFGILEEADEEENKKLCPLCRCVDWHTGNCPNWGK
jgi:hypothetical protein